MALVGSDLSLRPRSAPRRSPWARAGRLALLLAGAVAALAVIAGLIGFLGFVRSIALHEPSRAARADGIVVLTGGSQRLSDGLSLLEGGHGRRVLFSGVHQRSTREEIARMGGVSALTLDCCVDLGKSARNTIGNAIEARRWARANGFTSLLVVTSNYHMPRTLAEFSHALGDVRIAGYPVVSDSVDVSQIWRDGGVFKLVLGEYAKYAVARIRQLFESDPEQSRWPVLVGRQKPLAPFPIERAPEP
jgi:uncharacterized SAM-binding protein YcdF (DUF218 family)